MVKAPTTARVSDAATAVCRGCGRERTLQIVHLFGRHFTLRGFLCAECEARGERQRAEADRAAKGAELERQWATVCPPLAEHLADFRQALLDKGNTAAHADLTHQRVRDLLDGTKAKFLSDLDGGKVMRWLADRRAAGLSAASSNHYLTSSKAFTKWLVRDGRLSANPLDATASVNARTDRRRERRAMEPDEIRWLLDVTAREKKRGKASGPERALLYRLAIETGLRANELRSLTAANFDLTADPPTICVEAGYSKRRRRDVLPLRPDTAALLADFLAAKLPGAAAFHVPDKPGKMFLADLAAARRAWLDDAAMPTARAERERSCFLSARDDAGRVLDFHALRHTTGSLLAAAGVHPKVAQSLMRHSTIDLTMSRYTHTFRGQDADAVAALPDLSATPAGQRARATGTDDAAALSDAPGSRRNATDGSGSVSRRPNRPAAVAGRAGAAGADNRQRTSNADMDASS